MLLSDPARYISTAVVPAVMISACGLLVLALYNRLSNIVSRLRQLFRERLHHEAPVPPGPDAVQGAAEEKSSAVWIRRMLDREMHRVLRRGRLVRNALICLIGTITCMALCSLTGGLGTVWEEVAYVTLGLFITGQVLLLGGLGLALMELIQSLRPVEIESQMIEIKLNTGEATREEEV